MTRSLLWIAAIVASAGACALSRDGTAPSASLAGGDGGDWSNGSTGTAATGTAATGTAATGSGAQTASASTGVASSAAAGSGGGGQTSSTATSSTATSSTAAGQGGGPVEMDCLNGSDDDGDGAIDCADSDCTQAGYGCLAPLPAMLSQVVLAGGACPGATAAKSLRTCADASCTCAASTGACSIMVNRWDGNSCNGAPTSSTKTNPGCYVPFPTDSSFMGSAASAQDTTCSPGPDIASADLGACTVQGGACAGGGACVPPGFPLQQACVLLPPGAACAAPYAYVRKVYDSAAATCGCDCTKSGEACDVGQVLSHGQSSSCSDPPAASAPIDGQCHSVGFTASYEFGAIASHAQCTPPTASMPAGEATLCCSQP